MGQSQIMAARHRKTMILCQTCHHKLHTGTLPDKDYLRKHVKGEPCAMKVASTVCAVRRVMISLLQAGGTEEKFLGYWHSWRLKLKVTKHARQAAHDRSAL